MLIKYPEETEQTFRSRRLVYIQGLRRKQEQETITEEEESELNRLERSEYNDQMREKKNNG